MLKKIIFLLFVSFFLVGCRSKLETEEIVFSSWGSITEVQVLKQIIKNFEDENPKIKINFMHIPQNYFQKIHLLFASKTAPDVLFMNNLYLPIYEAELEDLSDFITKEDYYPQTLSGMSYGGKILGVPRDISNLVLYVNLDKMYFPASNWTIDELLNQARKSTKKTQFGIGTEDDIYWLTPYLSYFGGGILDSNSNLMFDTPKSNKALSFYKDLVEKYRVAPTKSQIGSSTLAQMFLDEKIVMYLSGRWMYPKISEKAKFNWAVINFPYGESEQLSDVSGWVISKASMHKEASRKFVDYLSNEISSEYFTQTGLVVPARIKTSQLLNNNKHNEAVFIEVITHSKPTPVSKDYKKIIDKINNKIF